MHSTGGHITSTCLAPMPLLRRPRSAPLMAATAALLLLLLTEGATAFLFGRTKAGARAAAPLRRPPQSAAAAAAAAAAADVAAAAPSKKGVLGRLLDRISPLGIKDYGREELKDGIAQFYDESSAIWEEIWGEHMHHGYYYTGKEQDHQKAQVDMIDESLKFAGVAPGSKLRTAVDVGCGIGGSSRHIAKKYGAQVRGITLSPFQCSRARALTTRADLEDKARFQVADALAMPFADKSFDLVWSMESGEHMPDKRQFIKELARVAAPTGNVIVVTWCHRELKAGETLTRFERGLLKVINNIYYLPPWVSAQTYVNLAKEEGLQNVRSADWTETVKPFWPAVLRSSFSWRAVQAFLRSRNVRRGALAILYMMLGYSIGLIKFAVIAGEKK